MKVTLGDAGVTVILVIVMALFIMSGCGEGGPYQTTQAQQPPNEENTGITVLEIHRQGVDCIWVQRYNTNPPNMSCNWKVEK